MCDCISEMKAFIFRKTAEFLQLEGKSVGNTTDEKKLVCLHVCANTQKYAWVCALHSSRSSVAVRGCILTPPSGIKALYYFAFRGNSMKMKRQTKEYLQP